MLKEKENQVYGRKIEKKEEKTRNVLSCLPIATLVYTLSCWHPRPSLFPSPDSPTGQKHSNDPLVSRQCCSLMQLWVLFLHSSISARAPRKRNDYFIRQQNLLKKKNARKLEFLLKFNGQNDMAWLLNLD